MNDKTVENIAVTAIFAATILISMGMYYMSRKSSSVQQAVPILASGNSGSTQALGPTSTYIT